MHILVTGAKGFIGSHLVNYLSRKGHKVIGLDNLFHPCAQVVDRAVDMHIGDIRNRLLVESLIQNVDIVFHLAAQIHVDYSIKYPDETIDINVLGTLNILEACRKYKKRLIFASTSEAYGSSQTEFMSETHPLDCQSPYGASKVAADRLCKSYIDTYGMKIVIVRNFNIFGPYQNDGSYGSVIARFTKAAWKYEKIEIYGDGNQERDYMYIDDAIQAYNLCMNIEPGVYNFGTGKTVTINELARRIKEITGSFSKIKHIAARAGEVQRLCADISKAETQGFVSTTDFARDLIRYVFWYRDERTGE